MAAPVQHVRDNLSLTLRLVTSADRMPQITADLVSALSPYGSVATETARSEDVLRLPAPLRVDAAARRVFWRGAEVVLTRLEFDLLQFLATRPHHVHGRRELMTQVWHTLYVSERTVDVHVRRLRHKLGQEVVRTVRGVGYQFGDPGLLG